MLRRLYRILTMPTPSFKDPDIDKGGIKALSRKDPEEPRKQQLQESEDKDFVPGLHSVLTRSLTYKSTRIKDCLLSIANMCEECQLSNFAKNLDHVSIMMQNVSPNFMELVRDSFSSTNFCKKIISVNWYKEVAMVTFRQNSSMLTEQQCDEIVKRKIAEGQGVSENDMTKQQVEVTMLNIDWLLTDNCNFVDFVRIIKDSSSEQIYQTALLNTLLEEFWEEYFGEIFFRILMPWAMYLLT